MTQQKNLRVLVVEDDRVILRLYEKFFTEQGYQWEMALSGTEALQKIEQAKFDLVCLDLRLPDMDGILLVEKIKNKLEWIPVIIVTGNPSLESTIEAINAGIVTEYIVKPFDAKELIFTIRKAIEKAKLAIENKRLLKKVETTNQALLERVEQLEHFAREALTFKAEVNQLRIYIKDLEQKLGIPKNS